MLKVSRTRFLVIKPFQTVELPADKSILSKEIFIINLCFALSIYCFPDGEFLKENFLNIKIPKKSPHTQ